MECDTKYELFERIFVLSSFSFEKTGPVAGQNPVSSSDQSRSLLMRIQQKDSAAWAQLLDLYSPLVTSWCQKSGLRAQDIADVLQEVFLTVSKSIGQFYARNQMHTDPEQRDGIFRSWLWSITRSRMCDWARRQRPDKAVGGSTAAGLVLQLHDPANDTNSEEPTTDLEKHTLVSMALAQIKEEFAEKTWTAFWRCVVDGLPTAVASQQLEMSAASVRQARCRVLRRLREQLGDM